jgi:putative endonuclease
MYMQKFYFVYILLCSDDHFYIGITNDLHRRVCEHQEGVDKRCYTYTRRPVELVYHEEFTEVIWAIEREKQLKKWNRDKKKALVDQHYDQLKAISRSTEHKEILKKQGPSTGSGRH